MLLSFFFPATPKQEMEKQNGEHSSGWEVERHKVENGSLE